MADLLEVDYTTALGVISCLWLWCAEYAPTGDLRKFTDNEIRFAGRDPSLKLTKEALNTCGLLTEGQFINDWGKHGLKLLNSKRKANREYAIRKRNSGYPLDTERVAIPNHTIPNHTTPNLTQTKDKDISASAAKPIKKLAEKPIPNWQDVIDHMDRKWLEKKKARFYWRPHYFKSLRTIIGLYQPWGVMALWDLYLGLNDSYVKNAGYSFEMFQAKISSLVDDPVWKMAAKKYEEKLCPGPPREVGRLLTTIGAKP